MSPTTRSFASETASCPPSEYSPYCFAVPLQVGWAGKNKIQLPS